MARMHSVQHLKHEPLVAAVSAKKRSEGREQCKSPTGSDWRAHFSNQKAVAAGDRQHHIDVTIC
jgi:hypothetical protein